MKVGDRTPLKRRAPGAQAVRERRTIHIPDRSTAAFHTEYPDVTERDDTSATLSVPLLHEDVSVGFMTLVRLDTRGFSAREITLIEAFADQAAIAVDTHASSRNWSGATASFRRATARSPRRWSNRRRLPRCCG